MEFTYQVAFRYKILAIIWLLAHCLKLQDPWIICHYNEAYANFLQMDGLVVWVFALELLVAFPAWPGLVVAYDTLDRLKVQGMTWADQWCRKFWVEAHPWSPGLADTWAWLDLMWALMKRAEGKWVSNS